MYKVLLAFGTRPEAIKMCPLIIQLKKARDIECVVCLTGQHREMLDQVMELFGIHANYNLNIMRPRQTLTTITMNVMEKFEGILEHEKPDLILVHGDTSTSFAAALMSFYHKIPIGHVEAGLRTYDMFSPYPEEFNREAVDLIADLYFAPTQQAKENLIHEGKKEEKIFVTGNTVIDALKTTVKQDYANELLTWAEGSRLILLTVHRRENLGNLMKGMFRAVKRIAMEYSDVKVIYPVHKNPIIKEIAQEILGNINNVKIIEPLDVYDFHNFMSKSYLILTDSGGIQEEAPALGKPVLVMRNTTERPEGVMAGTLKLVGTDEESIYVETKTLLDDGKEYEKMKKAVNPYGDGDASEKIVKVILNFLKSTVEKY